MTGALSELGVDDDNDDNFSFDTMTIGYRSVAYNKKMSAGKSVADGALKSPAKSSKTVHGNKTVSLPFALDCWRDSKSQGRVSVQVQLLSGSGDKKGWGSCLD